jgi:hypothetical protein
MTAAPPLILQTQEPESELERLDRSIERFLIIVITIIGGVFRFVLLNRPTVSAEEAALYARVTGSFRDLAQTLEAQHLAPLHYEIYWALGKFVQLNPYVLRVLPAIAGTLLIPAVYWLARQVVSVRAAILAAAITACSGYLLAYARDAEFYTPFWLLTVLHLASLLHWLRRHNARGYLAWIATGAAMLGWHLSGATVLALDLLIFLTSVHGTNTNAAWVKRFLTTTYMVVLFLIGLVIIPSAITYYLFSEQIQSAITQTPVSSPTTAPATRPTTLPATVAPATTRPIDAASLALIGWHPPAPDQTGEVEIRLTWYLSRSLLALAIFVVLTLLPWSRPKVTPLRSRRPWEMAQRPNVHYTYQTEIPPHERLAQPIWRIALWLAAWIVLPAYAFYCVTTPDFATPRDLAISLLDVARSHLLVTVACAVIVAGYGFYWIRKHHPIGRADLRRGVFPLLHVVAVAAILVGLCVAIVRTVPHLNIPASFLPHDVGFILPPIAILLATLIFRIHWNLLRRVGIVVLLAANITQASFIVFKNPNPRADLLADDLIAADIARSPVRTYVNIPKVLPAPDYKDTLTLCGNYYLAIKSNPGIFPAPSRPQTKARDPWQLHQALSERAVALHAANHKAQQLVLWDCAESPTPTRDGTLEQSAKWTLAVEQRFGVYDPQTWQKRYTLRRRIFVAPGTPTAQLLTPKTKEKQDVDAVLEALEKLRIQAEEQANPKPTTRPAKPAQAAPRQPPQRRLATRRS